MVQTQHQVVISFIIIIIIIFVHCPKKDKGVLRTTAPVA